MVIMNDLFRKGVGEKSSIIRATFKKTINTKQYESEVIEAESVIEIEHEITGIERAIMMAIMRAQLEYEVYASLAFKQYVTNSEFVRRVQVLTEEVQSLVDKARTLELNTESLARISEMINGFNDDVANFINQNAGY